jgi:toxin ParE1/3/4
MTRAYRVVERPAVMGDYIAIAEHIERWTFDRAVARQTVTQIRKYVKGLRHAPHRGTKRDDIRPGLRIVTFHKRCAIALEIDETARTVTIIRVFYGGQDYETALRPR